MKGWQILSKWFVWGIGLKFLVFQTLLFLMKDTFKQCKVKKVIYMTLTSKTIHHRLRSNPLYPAMKRFCNGGFLMPKTDYHLPSWKECWIMTVTFVFTVCPFCSLFFPRLWIGFVQSNKQANKQVNKQMNEQSNEKCNKQMSKQMSKQISKQTNKQNIEQASKQMSRRTSEQIT